MASLSLTLPLSLSLSNPTTIIITQPPSSRNSPYLNNTTWKCFTTITHYTRLKSSNLNPSGLHNTTHSILVSISLPRSIYLLCAFFCFSFSWFLIFYKRDQLFQSGYSDPFNLKPTQSEHPTTIITHPDRRTDLFKTHWSCQDPKPCHFVASGPWRRGFRRSQRRRWRGRWGWSQWGWWRG